MVSAKNGAVEGVAGVVVAAGGKAHVLANLTALQAEADARELRVAEWSDGSVKGQV